MSSNPPQDRPGQYENGGDPLEAALAEFHRALISGERPDPEEYCRNHPECGPGLQARINDLIYVFNGLPEPDGGKSPTSRFTEMPERIGRFRILKELGRGGQGAVYLAEDEKLHRNVALKVLVSGFEYSEYQLKRFEREAESASRLNHPGICSVFETGEAEGYPFIAMQYVEGESLAKMIARARKDSSRFKRGIFDSADTYANAGTSEKDTSSTSTDYSNLDAVSKSLYLIEQAARALHVAHESGIIHRDLKPGNIVVTPEGEPVILDFGLARMEDSEGPSLTMSSDLFGTPAYMSPEQIRGDKKRIGRRTDIYSLAATLFECLCLCPPFESATREGLFRAILTEAPPDLRKQKSWASSDLDVVMQTALAKEPDHRYQTALDFAEELRRIRQREPILTRRAGPLLRLWRWSQRNPKLAAAVGGILFLLVFGLTVTAYFLAETRSSLQTIKELSDIRLLPFLEDWEKELWPALPREMDEMNQWLVEAEGLSRRHVRHSEKLEAMRAKVNLSGDLESQSEIEKLDTFLKKLSDFTTLIDKVRERLRFASTVKEETIDKFAREWEGTIAGIMDEEENPHYRGLMIDPVIGLIPLGKDPSSKLFEFAHLQTGEVPVRDPDSGQLEITEETGLIFVLLPGGTFRMGAVRPGVERPEGSPHVDINCNASEESPDHEVALRSFFISKFEMTQGQWLRIIGENPSNYFAGDRDCTLRNPVESVSWNDCELVVRKLNMVLPTEAQWEYACRAGTTTVWYKGDDPTSLRGYENLADEGSQKTRGYPEGWSCEAGLDDGYAFHAEVGRFKANPFGLHDMAGNVSEWTRCKYGWYGIHAIVGDDGERPTPEDWRWIPCEFTEVEISFILPPTAAPRSERP